MHSKSPAQMRFLLDCTMSVLLIICLGPRASAQDPVPVITGPVLGFVQDSAGSAIQPILGIAGASILGPWIPLGADIRNAVLSPNHDYAVAVRGDNAEVVVIQLGSNAVTVNSLDQVRAGVDVIAISPMGTATGLYGNDSKIFQSVVRLSDTPEVIFEFDASGIPGSLRGMAVSDDGKLALLNFADGGSAELLLITSNGLQWLVPANRPSAQSFLPGRHDAVIADDGTQEVFQLLNADQAAARVPLVSFGDGFDAISAVSTSADGQRVFVTSAHSENVTVLDLQTMVSGSVPCGCQSSGLQRMKGSEIFRLSDASAGPIALLDASSSQPRVILVPANNNHQ